MVVLFRVAERAVDRIRVFSEDCELDAGGRTVTWLESVRPADSIALLESFATPCRRPARSHHRRRDLGRSRSTATRRPTRRSSGWSRLNQPEAVRKKVTFWLGNTRGAHGLATLRRVLKDDPSAEVQKAAVFGVSQSQETGAFDVLLGLARTDPSPRIRGEAIFWLAQKAGRKSPPPSPNASSRIPTPR